MITRIKKALKAFWDNLTYPRISTKLDAMSSFEHKHICLAFRLLDINDFKMVCPIKDLTPDDPEWHEECDHCPCQAILYLSKSQHIFDDKASMELIITNPRSENHPVAHVEFYDKFELKDKARLRTIYLTGYTLSLNEDSLSVKLQFINKKTVVADNANILFGSCNLIYDVLGEIESGTVLIATQQLDVLRVTLNNLVDNTVPLQLVSCKEGTTLMVRSKLNDAFSFYVEGITSDISWVPENYEDYLYDRDN